jgi:hypothetical protein
MAVRDTHRIRHRDSNRDLGSDDELPNGERDHTNERRPEIRDGSRLVLRPVLWVDRGEDRVAQRQRALRVPGRQLASLQHISHLDDPSFEQSHPAKRSERERSLLPSTATAAARGKIQIVRCVEIVQIVGVPAHMGADAARDTWQSTWS